MTALDLLKSGRFDEAIEAYKRLLAVKPDDAGSLSGLASAYMNAGRYEEAIPLKLSLHDRDKAETPDSPGQWLDLSCAYWCLRQRARAVELAKKLCAGILDRSIKMAPDLAGGATFGLVLHYMAVTAGDDGNRDFALEYLRKLNIKYDKRPTLYRYPVETVKQLLGEVDFKVALEAATGERSLTTAYQAADRNRSIKIALGVALFHDGVMRRASGEEPRCMERMKEVQHLGYQTESIRWQLARHEITGPPH